MSIAGAGLTPRQEAVAGLVLAGGRARRMNGIDKGLIEIAGRPMIDYVLDRLRPQVGQVLINANRNPEIYNSYGHPVVADALDGFLGPLAGVSTDLEAQAYWNLGALDWDRVTTRPSKDKLLELGLDDVAEELWPPQPAPPDLVLKLAASANIIEMPVDQTSVRFYHQLLQEYFVARQLLQQDPTALAEYWRWPWMES